MMSKWQSFFWGLVPLIIGRVIPIPFIGLLALGMLYFYYLKPRGILALPYLAGYFIFVIILTIIMLGVTGLTLANIGGYL